MILSHGLCLTFLHALICLLTTHVGDAGMFREKHSSTRRCFLRMCQKSLEELLTPLMKLLNYSYFSPFSPSSLLLLFHSIQVLSPSTITFSDVGLFVFVCSSGSRSQAQQFQQGSLDAWKLSSAPLWGS